MLFTSRAAVAAALSVVAVAVLGVPAAGAPTVSQVGSAAPDARTEVLVSITAPQQVDVGEPATLGVTVRDIASGVPVAGTLVVLLRRAAGEGDWAEADRTLTDTAGRAILTAAVRPPATDFKARAPGTNEHRTGRSARVTVAVS
jgi:hypothetical protein